MLKTTGSTNISKPEVENSNGEVVSSSIGDGGNMKIAKKLRKSKI